MPTKLDDGHRVTLKRSLRYRDLILYGIILIQPTAPMPVFGVIYQESRGHVLMAIVVALIAMLFTAYSYGRMARAYPKGGSAFTYVSEELHPSLGYMTCWCMAMDYILNPLICTTWSSKAAMNFVPEVPYVAWVLLFRHCSPRSTFAASKLRPASMPRLQRGWES
jgi:putrescine importer